MSTPDVDPGIDPGADPGADTVPDEGLWDYEDPAGSEARLRARLGGASGAERAELLTQVARAQGLQRRFEEGHRTLDEVEPLLGACPPRVAARHMLERGRLLRSAGQRDDSRPHFAAAWELASAAGEEAEAVDAAHMLALVAPGEAAEWHRRALDVAERSARPRARRWAASLLNNMGWEAFDSGDVELALLYFQRALLRREQMGQPRETRVARWCVARAKRALGRAADAIAIQRQIREEAELAGEPDGFIEEELGELLLTSDPPAARAHFARAYELMRGSYLAEHEPDRLERIRRLGAGEG